MPASVASDVPTAETLAFVSAHAPPAPARILEVGCGDGALASRLQGMGHQVVGLDASADAVAQARRRGLDARVARWPDFEETPFDVVVFTRSLHHIDPLPQAVGQAKKLLKRAGKVLVEDFAFAEIEPLAAEWLHEVLSLLDAARLLRRDGDGLVGRILRGEGLLAAWHAAHEHDLHSASAMSGCLREHFARVDEATAPYLYRYVCAVLEENADGYRVGSRVLGLEKRFAEAVPLFLIGRRYVGSMPAEPGTGAVSSSP